MKFFAAMSEKARPEYPLRRVVDLFSTAYEPEREKFIDYSLSGHALFTFNAYISREY